MFESFDDFPSIAFNQYKSRPVTERIRVREVNLRCITPRCTREESRCKEGYAVVRGPTMPTRKPDSMTTTIDSVRVAQNKSRSTDCASSI